MKIAIVGAGGFAREVEWLIKDIGRERAMPQTMEPLSVAGFLVSDPSQRGKNDSEALGDFSWLRQNRIDGLAMGIGNPTVRLKLAAELQSEFPNLKWACIDSSERQVRLFIVHLCRRRHYLRRKYSDRKRPRRTLCND
jgi:hypothetical protein